MLAQQIFQGLLARGQSPIAAIGLLANMQAESGLNPGINEIKPVVPGSRGGFGLNQWTGPRRRQFEEFARQRGARLDDLDTQLDFTVWELGNTERNAAQALAAARTPAEAARIVSDKFLRPGIPRLDKRIAAAEQFSGLLGGDYTPPPADQMQPVGGRPMQQGILAPFQKPEDNRPFMERLKDGAKDGSLWDALAIGFNSMRGQFADPSITEMAQGRLDQRQEQAQANATAEWLRANGREDLAAAIEGGVISGAQAFEALQPQAPQYEVINDQLVQVGPNGPQVVGDYRSQEAPALMNTGDGRIYNPATGEWILAPEQPEGPLSALGKLEADRAAGLISDEAYQAELARMAPQGMSFESDGAGGFRVIQGPGAGSGKPLTEGQSKDNVFATRAEGALADLEPVANELADPVQKAAQLDPTGIVRGSVQSDAFQKAHNAGQEFLQALLRKDTGASITPDENSLYGGVYLPQPGDNPAVLEQKQKARRRALEAMKSGMSPEQILMQEKALDASGSQKVNAAPETKRRRYNPQTGEFE